MTRMNALHNSKNPFQGDFKKVLTVCSAGLLRSPTLAYMLCFPTYSYNTRSCGVHDYALIQIDSILVNWADIIIFLHKDVYEACPLPYKECKDKRIIVFNVPDEFGFRDPKLIDLLKEECIKHNLIESY